MIKDQKFCVDCKWQYVPLKKDDKYNFGPVCHSPSRPRDLVTGEYNTISCRLARSKVEDIDDDDHRCTQFGLWFERK